MSLILPEYLIIHHREDQEWNQACCGQGMECLEEEKKLDILGDLLKSEAKGEDGDELGDVEQQGQNNDGEHMDESEEPE